MNIKSVLFAVLIISSTAAFAQDSRYKVGNVEMGYQPRELFMARVPQVKAFTDFIFDVAPIIEKHLTEHPPEGQPSGTVLIVLKPSGLFKIWTMFGASNQPLATEDDLSKALVAVKVPPIEEGPIALGVKAERFGDNVGNKLRVPAQWVEVARREKLKADSYLVDKIIPKVWPN